MSSSIRENTEKIPKIIHYCWFGGKPIPPGLQSCIDTWSKLKGYKVMRWDETNCSFDENEFVRKTYAEHKLGFIGDYYRLKAVYEYGGIYLDTDVKVYRDFEPLLDKPAFFNFIFDCSVGTAIIGSKPGNPMIKGIMDLYDRTEFRENPGHRPLMEENGKMMVEGYPTSNYYYTWYILHHYPQFILNNKYQDLGDFVIYPKELFEIGTLSGKHFAIHLNAGEWRPSADNKGGFKNSVKTVLSNNRKIYDKVQVMVRTLRYKKLNKGIPFYSYSLAQKNHTSLPEI
ncbi:Glycosyltransferase sugar-binding region containing DXD motif-containing protein [Lachnospiraceae bacterium KH1T2]|nr:Glycosyltransferase sugar-binding region containing DXD motif-containing protein [Lachnospiraceae bacterium KH1T2]